MNWNVPADDPRYGLGYALVAYVFLIAAFFAYVLWIQVRCARLQRRLEDLEQRLEKGGATRRS